MRENRPYGSEGGEGNSFPTPINCVRLWASLRAFARRYVGGLGDAGEAGVRIGDPHPGRIGSADRLIHLRADFGRRALGQHDGSVAARGIGAERQAACQDDECADEPDGTLHGLLLWRLALVYDAGRTAAIRRASAGKPHSRQAVARAVSQAVALTKPAPLLRIIKANQPRTSAS